MKVLLLLIQSLFVLNVSKADNNPHFKQNDINVVVDFVRTLQKPLNIHFTKLCWSKSKLIQLKKSFFASYFYTVQQTNIKLQKFKETEHTLFLVDLNCHKEVQETLTIANSSNLFIAPYTWLLLNITLTSEALDLNSWYFPVSSRVYIISKTLSKDINITSQYSLHHKKNNLINEIAFYAKGKQLYANSLTDGKHRRNLQQVPINSTAAITHPETTMKHMLDGREKHIDAIFKFVYPLNLHICDYMNITPTMRYSGTWGYLQADGNFNPSVMKDYQDGISEFAVTTLFVLPERLKYSQSYQQLKTQAAFTFRPPPLSTIKNIYVLPFNAFVWMACIGILTLIALVFYAITYVERRFPNVQQLSNTNMLHLENKIPAIVSIDIGIVCQQGMESEPRSLGGRIATYITLISSLFLFTAYSANILTLMQSTSDQINSVEALLHSKIKIGIEDAPWARYFFKIAPEPIMQELYKEKIAPVGKSTAFMTSPQGVKRMRNEFFAMHAETTVLYKLIQDEFLETEKCGLEEIEYFVIRPYQGCRRNSPYKEIFGSAYRKLDEYGIASREHSRIYVKKPQCIGSAAIFMSVSMQDTYAAHLILAIGLSLCFMVFIIEHIYFYKKEGEGFVKLNNVKDFFHQKFEIIIEVLKKANYNFKIMFNGDGEVN